MPEWGWGEGLAKLTVRILTVHEQKHVAELEMAAMAEQGAPSERHLEAFAVRVGVEGRLRGLLEAYAVIAGDVWKPECADPECLLDEGFS